MTEEAYPRPAYCTPNIKAEARAKHRIPAVLDNYAIIFLPSFLYHNICRSSPQLLQAPSRAAGNRSMFHIVAAHPVILLVSAAKVTVPAPQKFVI